MQCPKCKSDDIRPSPARNKDLIWLVVAHRPFWCQKCSHRFYAMAAPTILRAAGIILAVLVIGGALYLATQPIWSSQATTTAADDFENG